MESAAEDIASEEERRGKISQARKTRILLAIMVYSAFLGAASTYLADDDRVLQIILSLPNSILGLMWCREDAEQRNFHLSKPMVIALVLLSWIAFPFYAFKTRGIAGIQIVAGACVVTIAAVSVMLGAAALTSGLFNLFAVN